MKSKDLIIEDITQMRQSHYDWDKKFIKIYIFCVLILSYSVLHRLTALNTLNLLN